MCNEFFPAGTVDLNPALCGYTFVLAGTKIRKKIHLEKGLFSTVPKKIQLEMVRR